ncbi:BRO-N domain-containing protein [Enterobacter ludwigii]|uniref:BRO-N domain-containing protein n=1 Tax=Enterobacter TaxID=547 RepID=UPI003BEF2864
MATQLAFNEINFNVINHNDQIWLSAKQLASALGYKCAKSLTNLFNENEEEFTPTMSLVIESMTNGINGSKRRLKVRVFSLRGAHLIAMFARTPVAKEFRRWVLDILDREVGASAPPATSEIIHGGPRTVVVHFDESGNVIHTEQAPEGTVLSTLDTYRWWMEQNGWLVISRDAIKRMTIEQLILLK